MRIKLSLTLPGNLQPFFRRWFNLEPMCLLWHIGFFLLAKGWLLMQRRQFIRQASCAAGAIATGVGNAQSLQASSPYRPRFVVASCMYGYEKLPPIVAAVPKTGAAAIDLWPKVHGDQREQLDEMGEEAFMQLLAQHHITLGCITQYRLGPFGLQDEMRLASRLNCKLIVTGGAGPKNVEGDEQKRAIKAFLRQMQPHLRVAEELGVQIAIENHRNNVIDSADALRWLLEWEQSPALTVALAPAHLPQDSEWLAKLIREFGPRLAMFYAWQFGSGFMQPMPREQELLQMPGRGPLDFGPMMRALREIQFSGWVEVMMHPTPRGVPIMDTTAEVTTEIGRAHRHLLDLL